MKPDTFTILSTRAPLVEVCAAPPYYLAPGGASVADGARTTLRVDLKKFAERHFRVEAPANAPTAVVVTDSPFGAFVNVRRCVEPEPRRTIWRPLGVRRWPRLGAILQRRAPSVLALWYLLTDDEQPCEWRDVGDYSTNQVLARGGDVIAIHFVTHSGAA